MHHSLLHQVKYSEIPRISPRIQAVKGNLDGLKGEISRERIKEEIKVDEEAIINWLEDWLEKEKGFGTIETNLTINGKKILAPIREQILKVYEYLYGKKGIKILKDILENSDQAPFILSIGYKYITEEHRYSIPSIKLRRTDESPLKEIENQKD